MKFSRIAMVLIVLTAATTALAQSVTLFDGTYVGVSATATYGCTPPPPTPPPVPGPLTIKNGAAQFTGGLNGDLFFQGIVTTQGALLLRSTTGTILSAKVDASGKITGRFGVGDCLIALIWQKQ
jgi:hypothetical protein